MFCIAWIEGFVLFHMKNTWRWCKLGTHAYGNHWAFIFLLNANWSNFLNTTTHVTCLIYNNSMHSSHKNSGDGK